MSESPTLRQQSNEGSRNNVDTVASSGGYVPMEDDYFQHSGLRGGKSCCVCFLVLMLLFVAVINALVTAGLLYFLCITHEGMSTVEFFPGEHNVRVLKDLQVDNLVVHKNIMGRRNKDLIVSGSDISIEESSGSKFQIMDNNTIITAENFQLLTSDGKLLFSTEDPLNLDLYQVKSLHASVVDVGSVISKTAPFDLRIESSLDTEVIGTEGVKIVSGGDTEVHAGTDIVIGVEDNTVRLNSGESVYLSPKLPLEGKQSDTSPGEAQYKLCICSKSGRVFAVKETGAEDVCRHGDPKTHPCSDA